MLGPGPDPNPAGPLDKDSWCRLFILVEEEGDDEGSGGGEEGVELLMFLLPLPSSLLTVPAAFWLLLPTRSKPERDSRKSDIARGLGRRGRGLERKVFRKDGEL